jgi:predicted metal-binding protein
MTKPIIARSRRPAPVLVCKKCLKRASEGKDVRRTLKRQLKTQRTDTAKAPRVVMTSCFGICPKRAVVMASGQSLQRGEFVLASTGDDVTDALKILQSS